MSQLFAAGAVMLITGGVVVFLLISSLGRWREGLSSMLDLWLAASLLQLAMASDGSQLAAAAAIVLIRQLVGFGLRTGPGGPPGGPRLC